MGELGGVLSSSLEKGYDKISRVHCINKKYMAKLWATNCENIW